MKPVKVMRYRAIASSGVAGFLAEVLADSPYLFWRNGIASGTTIPDASGNSRAATVFGTLSTDYDLGEAGLVGGDSDTAIELKNNSGYIRSASTYTFPLTNFTDMCVFQAAIGAPSGTLSQINQNSTPTLVTGARDRGFILGSNGKLCFTFWNGSTTVNVESLAVVADGTPHIAHAVATSSTVSLYIDGTLQNTAASVPAFNTGSYRYVGATNKSDAGGTYGPSANFRGIVDDSAWFNSALSAGRVLAHAQAGGFA